ncbi:MAG: SpoIIE family protein phosphatase [Gammaproteobacteria bacterium]|nr:SpoIIE family protein phosphatase [Gammaproteobacteria bacterium]MDJ0870862.1 SpoIIE family protein phosphatase [Gammaproteobacteria bacterium]
MKSAPFHPEEVKRLADLLQYQILDTEEEQGFDELTQMARAICDTPISLVSLVDEGRQWFKSRIGVDASETPRDIAFCAHAILQQSVFEVPNALEDSRFCDNPLVTEDPKIRFYAGAPLVSPQGYPLGTICVIDRKEKRLSSDQRRALEILSTQVVAQFELRKSHRQLQQLNESLKQAGRQILEKQQALEKDLEAAAEIQKTLVVSEPPPTAAFDFAWRFLPCDHVGGDICNILALDEDNISLSILDVSGHGVPSAMVTVPVSQSLAPYNGTGLVRRQVETAPYYEIASPSAVLNALDQEYPLNRFRKFFTICYMLMNTKTREIRYSSAGHPRPILLRAAGSVEVLEAGGTVIGLGGILPFEEGTTVMHPGDRLLLYTDGVIEHKNVQGTPYGEARLCNLLHELRSEPLEKLCDRLVAELNNFGGASKFQDDVTFLAVESR